MEPRPRLHVTALPITAEIIALALIMPVFVSALAYGQVSTSFKSNDVHPNGSITFRYKDPVAGKVLLNLEGAGKPLAMRKDSDGVWP